MSFFLSLTDSLAIVRPLPRIPQFSARSFPDDARMRLPLVTP
jgi:hypothetical protein